MFAEHDISLQILFCILNTTSFKAGGMIGTLRQAGKSRRLISLRSLFLTRYLGTVFFYYRNLDTKIWVIKNSNTFHSTLSLGYRANPKMLFILTIDVAKEKRQLSTYKIFYSLTSCFCGWFLGKHNRKHTHSLPQRRVVTLLDDSSSVTPWQRLLPKESRDPWLPVSRRPSPLWSSSLPPRRRPWWKDIITPAVHQNLSNSSGNPRERENAAVIRVRGDCGPLFPLFESRRGARPVNDGMEMRGLVRLRFALFVAGALFFLSCGGVEILWFVEALRNFQFQYYLKSVYFKI